MKLTIETLDVRMEDLEHLSNGRARER